LAHAQTGELRRDFAEKFDEKPEEQMSMSQFVGADAMAEHVEYDVKGVNEEDE